MYIIIWHPISKINIYNIFTIKIYSIMFIISFILGWIIMHYIYKKEKLNHETLTNLNNYIITGMVLGARLGQILFYDFNYYKYNLIEALLPIQYDKYCDNIKNCIQNIQLTGYQGLSSHGATIGLFISIYLYNKKFIKKNIFYIYDLTSIPIVLGASLIRIGNLFNSEIIGKPSSMPWAFKFIDNNMYFHNNTTIPRHPTQIYESITYFIIFLFLFFTYNTVKIKKQPGYIFSLFLIITWTSRFIIETIKEPQDNEFLKIYKINTGQILSIPFIVLGIICFIFIKKDRIKYKN